MSKYKKNINVNNEILSFVNDKIDVFEENYQTKFLKVFIEDRKGWAQQIIDVIVPEYFDGYYKILIDYEMTYFKKYRIVADYNDLKELVNDKEKDDILKEHIYGLIDKVKNLELEHQKKEFVKERAYNYFKSQNVKNTLIELAIDWKNNTYDSMRSKLEGSLKAGEPKDTGHDYIQDVEKRMKKEYRNPIPILNVLDDYIDGGVSGGELGLVMAPTGGGKSMMLVKFASTAMLMGKNVVYYSLELSEEAIGRRFDACFNKVPIKKVHEFRDVVYEKTKELDSIGAKLIVKRYPDGHASVNTFFSHLDWLKIHENFVPDIIIVDYADNMKVLQRQGELRHDVVQIYRELRAMGVELDVPVITASQTNGTGYEKKGDELGLGMLSEAKAKANICDCVFALGRDPEQVKNGLASLKILKNRNGQIGQTFNMIFNTNIMNIEIENPSNYTTQDKYIISGVNLSESKIKDYDNITKLMGGQLENILESQKNTS